MATDLRKQQGTTSRTKAVRPERLEPGSRWPVVAAGIVLVVLAAVAVLVFTQGGSQPVVGPDEWSTNVEGMMTDVREGSGYAPVAGPVSITYPHGLENPGAGAYTSMANPGAYAQGALTGNREGSGYEPVRIGPRVSLGSTSYADDALTEIREG